MSLGDFETQKKNLQEQIAAAETEAGLTLDMSEVESLNKQLETLEANKHTYEDKVVIAEAPASENQVKQITELGGTEEELVKREKVQDEKVEEVKEVLEEKGEELELGASNEIHSENQENLERKIYERQLKEITQSLQRNLYSLKKLEGVGERQVTAAPLHGSMGYSLMFTEETKKVQELTKAAMSAPRDSQDQKNAWEAFLAYSNSLPEGMDVESHGRAPEDVFVLVSGVASSGDKSEQLQGSTSLRDALEAIVETQQTMIKDLEQRLAVK